MSNLNVSTCPERYSELFRELDFLATENLQTAIPTARNIFEEGNLLFKSGGNSSFDSLFLRKTSETIVNLTSKATNEVNKYDKHELEAHIRSNKNFWQFSFPYEVPVFSYLYGTFDLTPIEHQPRVCKRINRQIAASMKAPAKLAKINNNSEEKPSAAVDLNNYLRTQCVNGMCSYFHLILDPMSFTRTIENIYNVSILIKDNLVGVFIDAETGLPFLKCVPKQKRQQPSTNSERKQFIESIDMKRWADLIKALGIKEPLRQVEHEMSDED